MSTLKTLHRLRSTIALVLILSGSEPCWAQSGEIIGRVISKTDGEQITGANVSLQGTLRGAVSDRDGVFRIGQVSQGTYTLVASCIGYQRVVTAAYAVGEAESITVIIEMVSVPVQIDPVVVTASKREQALQEVPISVSLVERRKVTDYNFPTVEEALRYVPGVNLVDTQVSIRGSSGYSRGAGSRVLMLIDGIPLLTGDTGELNFETIPIGQVERIEVTKGAGSALYGSNALGGVINVITKAPTERPRTEIRLYGGLYGEPSHESWDWGGGARFTDGIQLSHSQKVGKTGMELHGSTTGDEGYRRNDHVRRYNGYAKIEQELSSNQRLTGTFNIMHQSRESFLNWKDINNALVPPDIQLGDWVRSTRMFVSTQYQSVASEHFGTTFRALWYRNLFEDNIDTVSHRSLSHVLRGEGQVNWSPSVSHFLTFGLEGELEIVEADLFGDRSGYGIGIYLQDEIRITENLFLTLGARFDAKDLDSLQSDSELSPKAGVMFSPWVGTRFRASAGRGFRSPTTAEAFVTTTLSVITIVPNPNLKSERSYSYEVAVNQALGADALFDLALFRTDFSNLIEPRFIFGTTGQFMNVTDARIQGVETNLSLGLFSRLLFFNLSYTYINPEDLTLEVADTLKYRHRHLFYASGAWESGIFLVGADFRFLSEVEKIDREFTAVIPDAEERVPIYVTDIRFGVNLEPGATQLSVIFSIKNVFQYNYVEFIGNLAPPRSLELAVNWTM